MINIRTANERGHANHGWLNSWHTFSFANYFDPHERGFSDLLVINDDTVAPGRGFGAHPHHDMEIFSYVLEGALSHQDSMGNGATIHAGDIQLMSAGSGVVHSEMNNSLKDHVHFLQIWIVPNKSHQTPRYQQIHLSQTEKQGKLQLIMAPKSHSEKVMEIRQDTYVYAGRIRQSDHFSFALNTERYYYLHVATGTLNMNGLSLKAGDGAKIRQEEALHFSEGNDAEILLFDLRPHLLPER